MHTLVKFARSLRTLTKGVSKRKHYRWFIRHNSNVRSPYYTRAKSVRQTASIPRKRAQSFLRPRTREKNESTSLILARFCVPITFRSKACKMFTTGRKNQKVKKYTCTTSYEFILEKRTKLYAYPIATRQIDKYR